MQVLIILRDSDGDSTLLARVLEATGSFLQEKPLPFEVVIGVAHQTAEAWCATLIPAPDPPLLKEARRALGFDPTQHPERLRRNKEDKRDAKRVLRFLMGEAPSLEACESRATPPDRLEDAFEAHAPNLERLRREQRDCGLSDFIKALDLALPRVP